MHLERLVNHVSRFFLILCCRGLLVCSVNFIPIFDCNNKQTGCPKDVAFNVISLKDYFEEADRFNAPKEVLCAFLCQQNEECVSFNQMSNDECHMFRTIPYKIVEDPNCKLFQVNAQDGRYAKTDISNLALGRPTCQSSAYIINGRPLNSYLAVDGLNGTDPFSFHCSHTNDSRGFPSWFMIKLEKPSKIKAIKLLVRNATNFITMYRITNLTVGVTNESWPFKSSNIYEYSLCGYYNGPLVVSTWVNIYCSINIPPAKFIFVVPGVVDGNLCICEIIVYGFKH